MKSNQTKILAFYATASLLAFSTSACTDEAAQRPKTGAISPQDAESAAQKAAAEKAALEKAEADRLAREQALAKEKAAADKKPPKPDSETTADPKPAGETGENAGSTVGNSLGAGIEAASSIAAGIGSGEIFNLITNQATFFMLATDSSVTCDVPANKTFLARNSSVSAPYTTFKLESTDICAALTGKNVVVLTAHLK